MRWALCLCAVLLCPASARSEDEKQTHGGPTYRVSRDTRLYAFPADSLYPRYVAD